MEAIAIGSTPTIPADARPETESCTAEVKFVFGDMYRWPALHFTQTGWFPV